MSDLISREAAIEAIEELKNRYFDRKVVLAKAQDAVNNLPAAEKVGKWERKWRTFFKRELPCCSACGKFEVFERNYCPNCGARMKNGTEWFDWDIGHGVQEGEEDE